jgi:hypothetical protein
MDLYTAQPDDSHVTDSVDLSYEFRVVHEFIPEGTNKILQDLQ